MLSILEKLYRREGLTDTEAESLTRYFFAPETSDTQKSAILIALKMKGVAAAELDSFVHYFMEKALPVPPAPVGTLDLCGTGGDYLDTFNISTTASFVVAAAGVPVAKHGNRKISSSVGSADLLERLNVPVVVEPDVCHQQLVEQGLTFLFAPRFHPALKAIMPLRKELGTATLFNLMGPLLNPYQLDYQLVGTYDATSMISMAQTLRNLGRKKAVVIHGHGGMDEANLAGATTICVATARGLETFELTPADCGLKAAPLSAIRGASPEQKADLFRTILNGESSIQADTVALNAGIALFAANRVATIPEGVKLAQTILTSGQAAKVFHRFQQKYSEQEVEVNDHFR